MKGKFKLEEVFSLLKRTTTPTTVDTTGGNITLTGVLSGAGGKLTKAGSGTLTLSGANTYTGSTAVNGGTLVVNGSLAAASAVTVANGATLGGNGTGTELYNRAKALPIRND